MSAQAPPATHGCEVVCEDRPRDPWLPGYICNEDATTQCANCDRWVCDDCRRRMVPGIYYCEACSAYDEAH